jgi:hypothetical protein
MRIKLIIAVLLLLMAGAVAYAVTRKRDSYSFEVGLAHPVISAKPVTLLYTAPEDSFAFALSYTAGCYIGDVDDIEKKKMNEQGLNGWSPIIPTIPFDKGDFLYVKDGDIKMATLDLGSYDITPTTDNYT